MSSRSAAGGCSPDCIAQNCRQPPVHRPKKATRPSASWRNCRDVSDLSVHPSIHPSNHPSLPLCRLPARLFVRSVSFAPRTPLDLVLCNARAVPFLTSSPSLFLSPTPLFTADSIPRARSPLARARAYLLLPPLCPAAPLTFRRPPPSRTSSFQSGIDCETPSRARYGDGEGGEGRRRR